MAIVTPEGDAAIRAYLARGGLSVPGAPMAPQATSMPIVGAAPSADVPTFMSPGTLAAGPVRPVAAPEAVPVSFNLTPEQVQAMNDADKDAKTGLNVAAANSAARKAAGPVGVDMSAMEQPVPGQAPVPVAAAGPRYVGASWDPKRNPIRASTIKGIQQAGQDEKASIERSAQNEAGALLQRADHIDRTAQTMADNDAAVAEAATRRSMQLQAKEAEVNKAMADAQKAANIDPGRRFGHSGTATDFAIAAGGAIGGMLQGLRGGGRNDFMDTVNQAIERDIDAQKVSAQAAQQNVANARGTYAMMRERFGDDQQAEAATRAALLDQAKMQAEKLMAGSQSVQVQENGKLAIAQLDKAQLVEKAKLVDIPEFQAAHMVGGTAKPMDQKDAGLLIRLPDGRMIQGRTEKEAQGIRAAIPAVQKMRRIAKEIDDRRTIGGLLSPSTRADLQTLGVEYMAAMKDANSLGTLDDGLMRTAEKALGEADGFTSFAGQKGLKYADMAEKGLSEVIRAQSGEQVTPGYGIDKTGRPTPTATYQGQQVRTQAMPSSFKPGGK